MTKQVSELTNKATPVGSDELLIQETGGGTTKKTTILAALGAGIDSAFGAITASKFLKLGGATELTIASGAVTAVSSYHILDTEGDAASDDLDTINGGADYAFLVLHTASNSRVVTAKDGTGNLSLAGDFAMSSISDRLLLLYTGGTWVEVSRSDNA